MQQIKYIYFIIITAFSIVTGTDIPLNGTVVRSPSEYRQILNLNSHWLFKMEDLPDGKSDSLNDKGFAQVCLPHAFTIVPHRDVDTKSFSKVAWYRRHFTPSPEYKNQRFILKFQGASQITDVYLNGLFVGSHKGAYTPFSFDITKLLRFGVDNVIAVRVDSRQHKEIPPEGIIIDYMLFGGIARDVTMEISDSLFIEWVFATRDSIDQNRVNVQCSVRNTRQKPVNCEVESQIIDSAGKIVANGKKTCLIQADSLSEVVFSTTQINGLQQWDTGHPYLYTIRTQVKLNSIIVDQSSEKIGLRSISFSKSDGRFYINGKPLWLCGLNRHETFPFIGRAAANRLQAKDAEILKYELGCNVVRCSHYPQDPEFLNRCDQIGLLVLEEIPGWIYVGETSWQQIAIKNVEEMVMRDRNHPSVISWGVRINESNDFHDFYDTTNKLAHMLDPTRPTHGVRLKGRGTSEEFLEDIWTHNFVIPQGKPQLLPWLISESFGVRCQVRSWDPEELLIQKMCRFAEVMDSVATNKYIAGQIGWCAFDYNSSNHTADHSVCYYGATDMYRIPKFSGQFLKSQAEPEVAGPMVHICHFWKTKLNPNDVWVAGNCDQVELFVNGKSFGKKTPDQYPSIPHPLTVWKNIPFTAGIIKAVGYIHDTIAAEHVRRTPGLPVAIKMIPDTTAIVAGGDMIRVVVIAVDKFDQTVPGASNIVELSVSGAADFAGQQLIALEDGKAAFFVKSRSEETGEVICTAKSPKLSGARLSLHVSSNPQTAVLKKVLGQ